MADKLSSIKLVRRTCLKILSALIIFLVIAGIVFLIWRREPASVIDSVKEVEPLIGGSTSSSVRRLNKTYTHPTYNFSFNYPDGFSASGFPEGEEGYTILAQKPNSKESFQIFISDFDEPGPITPERIKKDIPDMAVEEPKDVLIGAEKNLRALIFFSRHPSLGRTREVWFVQNNNLYRVTAYADLDNLIGPVLETLKFQEN